MCIAEQFLQRQLLVANPQLICPHIWPSPHAHVPNHSSVLECEGRIEPPVNPFARRMKPLQRGPTGTKLAIKGVESLGTPRLNASL